MGNNYFTLHIFLGGRGGGGGVKSLYRHAQVVFLPLSILPSGTRRIFGRLSVQAWDLEIASPKLAHLAVQKFV